MAYLTQLALQNSRREKNNMRIDLGDGRYMQEITGQGRGGKEIVYEVRDASGKSQGQYRMFGAFGDSPIITAGGAQQNNIVDPNKLDPNILKGIQTIVGARTEQLKQAGLTPEEIKAIRGENLPGRQLGLDESYTGEERALIDTNKKLQNSAAKKLQGAPAELQDYLTSYDTTYENKKSAFARAWGGGKGPLAMFTLAAAGGAYLSAANAGTVASTAGSAAGTTAATTAGGAAPIVEIGGGVAGAGAGGGTPSLMSSLGSLGSAAVDKLAAGGAGGGMGWGNVVQGGLNYLASREQQKGVEEGLRATESMMDKSIALRQPYAAAGETALKQYQKLLGIGPEAAKPGEISELLKATPGYEFARSESERAATRAASAAGLGGSGNLILELQQRSNDLASGTYQSYLQNLAGLMTTGVNAATGQASTLEGMGEARQQAIQTQGQIGANRYSNLAGVLGYGPKNQQQQEATTAPALW